MLLFIYFCLVLCVSGISGAEIKTTLLSDEYCDELNCVGECKTKLIPNYSRTTCIKCPEIGEGCDGRCCEDSSQRNNVNRTLQCWQGICQFCHDADGNWICRERWKLILLISNSEIALGFILIFIMLGISLVLYKTLRTMTKRCVGHREENRRPSIGSLQRTVDERLRDAPPRYSAATASSPPMASVEIYLVEGFVHDSSVPPPPYTPDIKIEETADTKSHI